jgi:protein-disulfide isomerase
MRLPALAALLVLAAAPACAQAPAGAPADSTPADSVLARASSSRLKGAESATVTIIEISDFQCPFCAEFARTTLAQLDSAYLRTGKARLVYFNYPIPSHREAWPAAEAALCAGAQQKFWPMHDRLFAEQKAWGGSERAGELFDGYAAALGLDMAAYRACVAGDRVAPLLVGDVLQAAQGGIGGTPTFIIQGPGNAQRALSGAQPFSAFQAVIEEMLKP